MSTQRAASPKSRTPKRGLNIVLWVLQVLLAVFFAVASALPKLTGHPSADPTFDAIGYGDWFMYLVGALELAGAMALLIPLLSGVTALAFIALMIGAFVYEVTVIGSGFWYTPVILIALFTFIAWGRWDRTMALFALVAGQSRASTA
ncbi:DoxX family protein [Nocardiopsis aegyptia]|uniref:Putative membrane protein YphA (DoxX/SURF4 family) n=1 Tax=Nocardiopsis aegyptia TaxID=220378 RepID=A0A7Z0EKF1_9ACTN|nr:DoxX family protein [Nocardiopsis aegyptia]NYJ33727.1 putative membrane protein YphA (DoxX/SURF4 family) [Nocardiopsis aegyptia]